MNIMVWTNSFAPNSDTALKVSVFRVILVCIKSECWKIRISITPNKDTFYAVITFMDSSGQSSINDNLLYYIRFSYLGYVTKN